ncbi:MAG TPA: HAMP domain-containing sensor histidine kinase, partial [Candidatus Manganitrophaceae bacterium]|nr:HAMP domain-containing sensor histidine kinase [Candidatus Manganitrophaceae bacterium]
GMIGVSSDITERKEAEEALRKAKEALEEKMGQLQKRLAISQTLHWVSNQFALGGEIDLFLGRIVKEVADLTEAAKCSIGLIDPEEEKLKPQAYYGFKEEVIRRVEVPIPRNENDLLYRILRRGETVMLNRILGDPRAERYREMVEMLEIQSALVTPLQVRGKSIGVVGVFDKFREKPFSSDDLQLLQTVANQIAGVISIGRYYEDLQKTIQELRRKTIEAEEASRLKSQFLSNVSHEFRTPLNAIIGYTSLLLDKRYGPVGESQAVPLEGILRNADDLLKLVNDVLDLSRIEAGKTAIDLSSVEMPSLIEDVLDKMKPLIEKRPLSIQWRKINEIPKIESDPLKIRQIVVNLLSNAIKFTPQGMITVEAEDLPEREGIEVRVQDTGIGIKPEETSKIFEAFHQIDGSMTREYGGVGLGLAIVKNMVDLLKGEIHVRSEYGKGSRFTLFLPYRLQV